MSRQPADNLNPAQLMEAEERALVQQERHEDAQEEKIAAAEEAQARPVKMGRQDENLQGEVTLNTNELSECHEPTSADEMEAEERELVIEGSVDDVLTYTDKPLSDEEIRKQALTDLAQIDPNPKDGKTC